jgi:CheY-like chemotaxis protein
MPVKILVAENDPRTRSELSEFLEGEKFETISAKTQGEAELVVATNPFLGAIVVDKRLERDKDPDDESGLEVAEKAQMEGVARAPIIVFSTWERTSDDLSEKPSPHLLPRISHLTKGDGLEALAQRIREQIHLNLRETSDVENIPRYYEPPLITFAPNNGVGPLTDELRKGGEITEVRSNLDELETAANIYPSALFAIDVANPIGLRAIEMLHQNRGISRQNFYIVALTPADDFKNEALHGVNAYVTRHSPQTDALELIMQMSQYKIQMEKTAAEKPLTQLALLQYEELLKKLTEGNQQARVDVTSMLETVERALNLPFLTPNEALILGSLHSRMLAAGGSDFDTETLNLFIEGATMLTRNRARDEDVHAWMERARRLSDDFTFSWIDDELFSGDEENDE